ncbi:MAG: hypothetical protein WCJ30_22880 [Deltaproteobacteria bacterium]
MRTRAAVFVLTLMAFPSSSFAQSSVEQLAGGGNFACTLSGGTVNCWGLGAQGQLGATAPARRGTPGPIPALRGVTQIALGSQHGCARLGDGTVNCWGFNEGGMLGDGTIENRPTPVAVAGMTSAVELAAGDEHSCARLHDGTVQCWGLDVWGQIGDGHQEAAARRSPVQVVGVTNAAALYAGNDTNCARLTDGRVMCWGEGTSGFFPGRTPSCLWPIIHSRHPCRATAIEVPWLNGATSIAFGNGHVCASLANGTVQCVGENFAGQLGNGTTTAGTRPRPVPGLAGVVQVAAIENSTCARLNDGTIQCWGSNRYGDLGDGTTDARPRPAASRMTGATALVARWSGYCALNGAGAVLCWGFDTGDVSGADTCGSDACRLTPTAIGGVGTGR